MELRHPPRGGRHDPVHRLAIPHTVRRGQDRRAEGPIEPIGRESNRAHGPPLGRQVGAQGARVARGGPVGKLTVAGIGRAASGEGGGGCSYSCCFCFRCCERGADRSRNNCSLSFLGVGAADGPGSMSRTIIGAIQLPVNYIGHTLDAILASCVASRWLLV